MATKALVEELNSLFKEPKAPKAAEPKLENNFAKLLSAIRSKFGEGCIIGEPKDNGQMLILHLQREAFQNNQELFQMERRQEWVQENGCHLVSTLYNDDPATVKLCFCTHAVLEPLDTTIPKGGTAGPDAAALQKLTT